MPKWESASPRFTAGFLSTAMMWHPSEASGISMAVPDGPGDGQVVLDKFP